MKRVSSTFGPRIAVFGAVLVACLLALLSAAYVQRAEGFVYFQEGGAINHSNNDGTHLKLGFLAWTTAEFLLGPSFAVHDGFVYWTSAFSGRISRARPDGSEFTKSFVGIPDEERISDLAVNGSGFYWWENNGGPQNFGSIGHADMDGGNVDPDFITTPDWFINGALEADEEGIYWAGHSLINGGPDSSTTIGHANADGTGVNPALISFAYDPVRQTNLNIGNIALSYDHIYWSVASNYGGSIGRANLDGTGANLSLVPYIPVRARNIAIEGDHLFYADDSVDRIGRMNLDGTGIELNFIKERPGQVLMVEADNLETTDPIKARITMVRVRGPAKIKQGKKATYMVAITNFGKAEATGVRLKVTGKGLSFNTSVGKIAAGLTSAGTTKTVKVKLKPKKPGKIRATFKVTSENAGSKTVTKKIKVKKRGHRARRGQRVASSRPRQ